MPPSPIKSKAVYKSSGKLFRSKEKEKLNGNDMIDSDCLKKEDSISLKDCPLTLPDVSHLDHQKSLPRYSALAASEGISLEELDGLQLELELLLSSVLVRQMALYNQISIIDQLEKGKVVPKVATSPGKRPKKDDSDHRSSKKLKDFSGKGKETLPGPPPPSKPPKVRVNVIKNEPVFDVPELSPSENIKPPPPKNDITNRFWAMVDQYCQEVTADDIKVLEELLNVYNSDGDYYKIPPLGKHYTLRWAQEDLLDEQKEGLKLDNKRKDFGMDYSEKLLKEVDLNGCTDDTPPLGPLTQRVIAGLVEENVLMSENIDNKALLGIGIDRPGFMKALNLGSPSTFEKRIKKELQEQGILDASEDEDDEILMELKRCQAELRAVSNYNQTQLSNLLRSAGDALYRHDLKKKLKDVDAKVIDAYKSITAAKLKKKVVAKKEKDLAWKTLKEREALIKQLDLLSNNNS